MKRLLLAAAVLATVLAVAESHDGAADAARRVPPKIERAPVLPARVKDKDGRTVVVRNVSRIVPLNGDIAEVVFSLGLGANIVGVDTSATFPKNRVSRLPKIGYQRTLSAEGILSLSPTVVVGTESAGPPSVIVQLRSAGVPVVIVPESESLYAGPSKLRWIGKALGVPRRGERLAKQVSQQIRIAGKEAGRVRSRPRVAFLYVRGRATQMIGGTETRSHTMILAAGARDAGAESGVSGYKPITAEALVAAQPDVLLFLTAGLESIGGVEGALKLPGVAQTPAGRNRRILHFDDLLLLGLGPRTGSALRALIRGLHPELR